MKPLLCEAVSRDVRCGREIALRDPSVARSGGKRQYYAIDGVWRLRAWLETPLASSVWGKQNDCTRQESNLEPWH